MSGINGAVEDDALEQWQSGLQDACDHTVNLYIHRKWILFLWIYSLQHKTYQQIS